MIPYFAQPALSLGPIQIHAFGALAALAVLVGGRSIVIRAVRNGIPMESMLRFCFCVYACALAGAYLAKFAYDDPAGLLADPARIIRTPQGTRSVGGVFGGFLGALVWAGWQRWPWFESLRRMDIIAYAMPFSWMIGRLGCALAHDHRGFASNSVIAVRFPEGPRYDLGLIEFFFLALLAAVFKWLDRRPRPVGFFFGLYGVTYGAFRVWLDTLHLQPYRFYGGAAGVLIGLAGWALVYRRRRTPNSG